MTRHGLLWLVAIIFTFLFAPLLVGEQDYEACVERELTTARQWYDDTEAWEIVSRANRLYGIAMVNTGIDPLIRRYFVKPIPEEEISPGVKLPGAMQPYAERVSHYWGNFLHNIWLFLFRVAHSWLWIIYLAPFLVAIAFDGVMTRKAKLASFIYTSPTVYNLSWHLIIALSAVAIVTFSIVTPISVFFYPVVITASGMLARMVLSNIQHSA